MTGIEYIEKYFNDNGAFDNIEDKEWFASLLDDYAINHHRARANVFYTLLAACCFWKKQNKAKEPINKNKEKIEPREMLMMQMNTLRKQFPYKGFF